MKGTKSPQAPTRATLICSIFALLLGWFGPHARIALAADTSHPSSDVIAVVRQNTSSPENETGWLESLEVSGALRQTFGMWQNPSALRDFTKSRNNLATARTQLQVDENYSHNDNNSFFMREWFVYEPPYSFNSANNRAYSEASSSLNTGAGPQLWPFPQRLLQPL